MDIKLQFDRILRHINSLSEFISFIEDLLEKNKLPLWSKEVSHQLRKWVIKVSNIYMIA